MSAKSKAASAKDNWQAARARYAWHLRPPFKNEFDRKHWWEKKSDSEIEPIAALYELARRHPRVGQLRLQFLNAGWYGQELRAPLSGNAEKAMVSQACDDLGRKSEAIHCLCLIGLKSWPTLGDRSQDFWASSAGKMKGLDCRDDILKCSSIILEAGGQLLARRAFSLKHPQAKLALPKKLLHGNLEDLFSSREMEATIARFAVADYQNGQLLISVAPDLTLDHAKILFEREYRKHQKLTIAPRQRARSENWLPLISAFENEEADGGKKSQAFIKYSRAMNGIRFLPRR